VQDLPVVPAGVGEFAPTLILAVSDGLVRLLAAGQVPAPNLLIPAAADYVTGRREKPQRMPCNAARGGDRERCGPQARFWEARHYPAWVWMMGSVGAGLIITITYIAFLRWVV
jgi:hypothetical protein